MVTTATQAMSTSSADLFGGSPQWPSGSVYAPDLIDADEESRLLLAIRDTPMHDAQYYQYTAKRRVASFGSSYDFAARTLRAADPMPAFLLPLRRRVAERFTVQEAAFEQALITEYRPGTPLGWHRDALNYDVVAGVSLGGRCRFRFRPYPPRGGRDPSAFTLSSRHARSMCCGTMCAGNGSTASRRRASNAGRSRFER